MIKYTIEIKSTDNQIREYDFHSEEIGALGEIKDEIRIKQGNIYILKRIGFTKEFLSYVLPEEELIKAEQTDKIRLFKGTNEVRIKDINGNYILEYYIDNPELELLATQGDLEESKSEIALLEGQASLKVSKTDLITEINQSAEQIKIETNKIQLEGHTTINEGFSVDLDGNMQCRDANINNLVNKSGIYKALRFDHSKKEAWKKSLMFKGFVGYLEGKKTPMYVNYSIPDNYVVDLAYLIIGHQSVSIGEFKDSRVKDIELYVHEINKSESIVIELGIPGVFAEPSNYQNKGFYIGDRIDNVWGNGVHSYTFPIGNRRKRTANIADTINEVKQGIIAIAPKKESEDLQDIPGAEYEYSAYMSANLYIYGYLDKKE